MRNEKVKTCECKSFSTICNGAFFAISLCHSGNIIHDIIGAICPGPLSIILPFKERIRLKLF